MSRPDFLRDQTALVTGGGSGIGRAIALGLARAGARLVLVGRRPAPLAETAGLIAQAGGAAQACTADIADEAQVVALFKQATAWTGRLDILVNNAGGGIFKPLTEMSGAEWDQVQGANLRGAFLCAREALRAFADRGGRILNVGSVVSFKGYAEQGAYTASKHGLLGLTKVLALEGAPRNVVVQAICPGGVATEMVGSARPDLAADALMSPEEVAAGALFLLGQQANAITDYLILRRRASAPFTI